MADLSKRLGRFGPGDLGAMAGAVFRDQGPVIRQQLMMKHIGKKLDTPEGRGELARGAALGGAAAASSNMFRHTPRPFKVPEIGSKLKDPFRPTPGSPAPRSGGTSFVGDKARSLTSAARVAVPIHAAAAGIGTAVQGLSTPTEAFEGRTGLRGVPARAAGVMQDLGNNLTFGAAGDVGERIAGMINSGAPPEPSGAPAADPDRLAKSEQVAGFIRGMPERRLSAESLAEDNSQRFSNDILDSLGFDTVPFDARRLENQQLRDFTDKVGLQNEIIEPTAPPTFLRGAPVSNPIPQAGSGLKTGRDLIDGSLPPPSIDGEEEKRRTGNPLTTRG